MSNNLIRNIILCFGALLGALGVMLAAAATHTADTYMLGNASNMALAHAPVLIAIAIGWPHLRTAPAASIVMSLGCIFFIGDLLMRHFNSTPLFPMAAPLGGIGMIIGWLIIASSAFLHPKKP